jgi:hypothetical protein
LPDNTFVSALAIDPHTPSTLYAVSDSSVFQSTDNGANWNALNNGLPDNTFVSALVIDPHTPSTLYAGTWGGVFDIQLMPGCIGDCENDGHVTVDEILTMVNIALGNAEMSDCDSGDANDDGRITIDEILRAVNAALEECG